MGICVYYFVLLVITALLNFATSAITSANWPGGFLGYSTTLRKEWQRFCLKIKTWFEIQRLLKWHIRFYIDIYRYLFLFFYYYYVVKMYISNIYLYFPHQVFGAFSGSDRRRTSGGVSTNEKASFRLNRGSGTLIVVLSVV